MITMLGRGSFSITPVVRGCTEAVEAALKSHPDALEVAPRGASGYRARIHP